MERDSSKRLHKKCKRRILNSSTDDEVQFSRDRDIPSRESTPGKSTRSDSVESHSYPGSSKQGPAPSEVEPPSSDGEVDEAGADEVVIDMRHHSTSSWHTDEDTSSETSTPPYNRGMHDPQELELQEKRRLAVLVAQEGVHYRLPKWLTKKRGPSILVLSDAWIEDWPWNDRLCQVEFHQGWPLDRWIAAIREGLVETRCHTVVIYLEGLKNWNEVPPMKNYLQTLTGALRKKHPGNRLFISNLLPQVHASPVDITQENFNFILVQAIRSTNRCMGKVLVLSAYEHFISRDRIVRPTHEYFKQNDHLTRLGCLILREVFMREAGVKPYWFLDESRSDV